MKNRTSVTYPVNSGLATLYGFAKGFNPNEEFSVWQKSSSSSKWLLITLSVLLVLLTGSVLAVKSFKDQKVFAPKAKEEGQIFMLAMPAIGLFFASALISFHLFEKSFVRRKAYRKMRVFAEDYVQFLAAIEATDEEVGRWSEHQIKNACLAILQAERIKIDKMKTKRGKASRLETLIEIYGQLNKIGIRFESVDAYIRDIRILTKPTPKKTKTKAKPKGKVIPYESAA